MLLLVMVLRLLVVLQVLLWLVVRTLMVVAALVVALWWSATSALMVPRRAELAAVRTAPAASLWLLWLWGVMAAAAQAHLRALGVLVRVAQATRAAATLRAISPGILLKAAAKQRRSESGERPCSEGLGCRSPGEACRPQCGRAECAGRARC